MTPLEATQSLVLTFGQLGHPAIAHSVYLNNAGPIPEIHVAVRPTYLNKIKVPKEHQGHTVVQVPWPKGA